MAIPPRSRVLAGSANHPLVSNLIDWLSDLRCWWNRSTVRIVAEEFCNFRLRILAILRSASLASVGIPLPDRLLDRDLDSFCLLNSFWPACIQGIQRQKKLHPYMGALETEMFGEAFQSGATWGWSNSCNNKHSEQPSPSRSLSAIPEVSSTTTSPHDGDCNPRHANRS